MNVVIRADASIKIGSGHVMRCLALADQMRTNGMIVNFVCRDLPGQMSEQIQQRGHNTVLLSGTPKEYVPTTEDPDHANWLNVYWEQDAEDTIQGITGTQYDWLIVDHYGLDARWHGKLRKFVPHVLVIDDLADRKLDCDYLLDQTCGRKKEEYTPFVPEHCHLFLGSKFALLRPEFARLRARAIEQRKHSGRINNILISMGGMDPDNITGRVLSTLESVSWDISPNINVVLGDKAPNITLVTEQANNNSLLVNVLTNVENMAELMLEADLAIGAGGTTSWERCCLGLPSLVIVLAKNQKKISDSLETAGAAIVFNDPFSQDLNRRIKQAITMLLASPTKLEEMSRASTSLTEGTGANKVVDILTDELQA